MLGIVQAITFFMRRGRTARIDSALTPAVLMSMLGTLAGIALLSYLAMNAYQMLRIILGISIVVGSYLLWRTASPLPRTSGVGCFAITGLVSGVLGGMFSAPGPPVVYVVYRQPWSIERMQESLIFMFGLGSALRLVVMLAWDQFNMQSAIFAMEAIPVALIVTAYSAKRPPPVSQAKLKSVVSVFLVLSGLAMVISSLDALLG